MQALPSHVRSFQRVGGERCDQSECGKCREQPGYGNAPWGKSGVFDPFVLAGVLIQGVLSLRTEKVHLYPLHCLQLVRSRCAQRQGASVVDKQARSHTFIGLVNHPSVYHPPTRTHRFLLETSPLLEGDHITIRFFPPQYLLATFLR